MSSDTPATTSDAEFDNALETLGSAGLLPFDQLVEGADTTLSREIAQKEKLVGKPFIITAARFSESDQSEGDFVSLEVTTEDNEMLVINDGSTGIRRDFVRYLTSKRWINPGDGDESGKETRYDNPCKDWSYLTTDVQFKITEEGGKTSAVVPHVRLFVKHGLRSSTYDTMIEGKKGKATTFYLN